MQARRRGNCVVLRDKVDFVLHFMSTQPANIAILFLVGERTAVLKQQDSINGLLTQAFGLPGQGIPWQDLDSRLEPTQSFPPKAGRGLLHVRIRCCVPVPHVLEHSSQSFQSLH